MAESKYRVTHFNIVSKWRRVVVSRPRLKKGTPSTRPLGDWVDFGANLDIVENREFYCLCMQPNSDSSLSSKDHSRYTDWAIAVLRK
jgi:hypothetical protein